MHYLIGHHGKGGALESIEGLDNMARWLLDELQRDGLSFNKAVEVCAWLITFRRTPPPRVPNEILGYYLVEDDERNIEWDDE